MSSDLFNHRRTSSRQLANYQQVTEQAARSQSPPLSPREPGNKQAKPATRGVDALRAPRAAGGGLSWGVLGLAATGLAVALGLVFILWPGSDARIVRPDATTAQKRSDARPSPRPLAADSLPINVEDMPPKLPALSWEQLLARGDENARARRWQPAAADFAAALRAHPDEHWHWFRAATILAWAQDQSAYRQHCAEMLRRFGETTDPPTAERTAKACLLVPGGVADLKPVVALADRAVAATDHEFYPFFLMARGLASYRSGEFDKALEQASKAISSDPAAIGLNVPAHLIVSMSQHRLGQADEARKSLRQARDIMGQEWFPGIDRGELGEAWWHDWLICQTLRREADGLIEGKQSKSQDSASAPPQPGRSPFE